MMTSPLLRLIVPACLLTAACSLTESEQHALEMHLGPLFYSALPQPSGSLALQGSTACFEITGVRAGGATHKHWPDTDPAAWNACYDITLAGAPITNGDCIVLDTLGDLSVEYTPRPDCPWPDEELTADRFRLEVVPLDGLRAGLEWYMEELARRWLEPHEPFPADLIPALDAPLQLVPGVELALPVNVLTATGERVAWNLSEGRVLARSGGGPAEELARRDDYDDFWSVRVEPGEKRSLSLELAGVELPVVEVVATPADQAASIEIVAGYDGGPYGARALVRDREGRVIVGAPIAWSLRAGDLAFLDFDGTPLPPEYLQLADVCLPPSVIAESRRAVLRAQLGDLSDEVELEWIAPAEPPRDTPFEPHPNCVHGSGESDDALSDRGCNCAAAPFAARDAAWLVLLALAFRRRNRRSV